MGYHNEDGDFIQAYSTHFILSNGQMIVLEYRNSSNGYYGGYLERVRITGLHD